MPSVEVEYSQNIINKYYNNLWSYIEKKIFELLEAQNIKVTYETIGTLELKALAKRLNKKHMKLAVAIFTNEPKQDLMGNTKISKRVFANLIDLDNDEAWYVNQLHEWYPTITQNGQWEVQIYAK